ncbi:hypothetical protein PIB30_037545 [Stylosanthes scabra]|uniref:Uncharacterized protein n=1 Tax=Stylosanthes scabra TaxID=79078 RepID=A0ABU6SEK2_9FABA|nr:hypothetical protein [Stylosanthes scabra]
MKSHHYPLTHQQRNKKRLPSTLESQKDTYYPEVRSQNLIAIHQVTGNYKTTWKITRKFITRKLDPKASSSRVGAMLRTNLEAQFLRNKAVNKWPTSKEESSKIGKIRYNFNRSHKDLNYPQLYKQGASPPQVLGYAVELVTEGTSSYLEYRDLAPHSKSFGQSLRDLTLTITKF